MTNIIRIMKKELGEYFNSPSAYIFLIVFLILGPAMFFQVNKFFLGKFAIMSNFFSFMPWVLMFFVPAVAMKIWAEEKRSGTEQLLMTMPVKDFEVVIGKYLAALGLLSLALLFTFPVPMTVAHFANPKTPMDWGPITCGYLASFLFGASILAIGTWASSLTMNQIIAFILTCAITFVLILLGFPQVTMFAGSFGEVLGNLSLYSHFSNLSRGVIDATDVVYYLSVVAFFLFLNVRSVESRKWK